MRNDYLSHNSLRYFPMYITLRLHLRGVSRLHLILKKLSVLFGQPLTSSHQKKKTANSMFKVSGSIKSNDLLLLNSRMFLRYNNDSLRLTFIITMERATFPSPLPASQEYSPLSPSTTFVITR